MKDKKLTIYNPGDPIPEDRTDWARLAAMTDEDIERAVAGDPDTFIPDEEFFRNAQVILPQDRSKQPITMRVSPRVLDFFKKDGERGYQSRMNAVLEAYVEAQENKRA